jgi:hypothetical protein
VDFSTSPLPATVLAARLNLTGLATSAITGTLTVTKTGTTARTATFPDRALTVAGISGTQTLGRLADFDASGNLTDSLIQDGVTAGALTLAKTGTTARTATFPDAAITVAGSASALTSGRVPYVTTGGLLTDAAVLTFSGSTLVVGDGSGACIVQASASVSTSPEFRWLRGGNIRWRALLTGTESGGDTGGSWLLRAATDAGVTIDDPISIVRAAGGAITLARPVTCTGAVTVPNGTAAAPGIRLTSEAHGLYRGSSTSLGFAAAGVAALLVGAPTGTVGTSIELQCPSAAERARIGLSATNSWLSVGAGTGSAAAGQARLYGNTHATKANYVEFNRGDTVSAFFDGSGILTVNTDTDATTTADGSVRLSGGLSVAKSVVCAGSAGMFVDIKNSTGALKVNSTQVVGAQGAAVADATDATSVIARLNDLLARLRAHGLIAT